jgi:hypothetical protein
MPNDIENELIEATKFRTPPGGYSARQDHLGGLARAANKLTDDQFDELTDDAANWVSSAIKALNGKAEIPEFDDYKAAEEAGSEIEEEGAETKTARSKTPKKKDAQEVIAKPSKLKPSGKKQKVSETRYDNLTGERNRYGIIVGTKTHEAILLYEEGITSAGIKEKLGGRFYNILKTLEEKGHRVERLPGGVFKLTHAEDIGTKKGKK